WHIWREPGGNRTKAFGKFAASLSTSSIRKSWPGSHSIAPRTWRLHCGMSAFDPIRTFGEQFTRSLGRRSQGQVLTNLRQELARAVGLGNVRLAPRSTGLVVVSRQRIGDGGDYGDRMQHRVSS